MRSSLRIFAFSFRTMSGSASLPTKVVESLRTFVQLLSARRWRPARPAWRPRAGHSSARGSHAPPQPHRLPLHSLPHPPMADQRPNLIHSPDLSFFRDFLERFEIPPAPTPAEPSASSPDSSPEGKNKPLSQPPEPAEAHEDDADLDEGCVPPDELDAAQVFGDVDREPSEEDQEKVSTQLVESGA